MATKNKRKSAGGKNGTWHGFVSVHLTKADKANIKAMVADGGSSLPVLGELVEMGYSIKMVWDSYSNCPSVMAFGSAATPDNDGWGMSARHSDLETAVAALLYQMKTFADENGSWHKPSDVQSEYDW